MIVLLWMVRALFAQALDVLRRKIANDLMGRKLNLIPVIYIVNSRLHGGISVAFAAAGPADPGKAVQGGGRILHMTAPGIVRRQRAGFVNDRQGRADGHDRPAYTPQPANGPGHPLAFRDDFMQGRLQINAASGVMIGRQQAGAVQHMMLRPVHADKVLPCQVFKDLDGIAGRFPHAGPDDPLSPFFRRVFHWNFLYYIYLSFS